jgi:membrane-associated HD superfamily phosphohydrolase
METKNNPIDDLQTIRNMMERSSKFLSLSGLSGIFAGCCALIGAAVAYFGIMKAGNVAYDEYMRSLSEISSHDIRLQLLSLALVVLIIALGGALFFSMRKARKSKQTFWNKTTGKLLMHLFIPLVAGGMFSLLLIWHNNIQLVASTTLIFYGLALVNAGKFTFGEIHYLGLCEIILGLLAGFFLHYGILFWTIGFGVLHIGYGWVMYKKYQ